MSVEWQWRPSSHAKRETLSFGYTVPVRTRQQEEDRHRSRSKVAKYENVKCSSFSGFCGAAIRRDEARCPAGSFTLTAGLTRRRSSHGCRSQRETASSSPTAPRAPTPQTSPRRLQTGPNFRRRISISTAMTPRTARKPERHTARAQRRRQTHLQSENANLTKGVLDANDVALNRPRDICLQQAHLKTQQLTRQVRPNRGKCVSRLDSQSTSKLGTSQQSPNDVPVILNPVHRGKFILL